jgi:flavodoxin
MLTVLVAHFSQTGNTEKTARAIYDEVVSGGHDVRLKRIADVTVDDLPEYDLVFLGSACHSADLAPPVLEILEAIPIGSRLKLAGFATHSCPRAEGNERDQSLHERWASGCLRSFEEAYEDTRLELLGYFGCQGAASPSIEEFIHSTILPDEDEWQSFVSEVRKHPDATDLRDAKEFAQSVLTRYSSEHEGSD